LARLTRIAVTIGTLPAYAEKKMKGIVLTLSYTLIGRLFLRRAFILAWPLPVLTLTGENNNDD
jgi:hypothetical protein